MVAKHNPDLVRIHSNFTAYADDSLEVAGIIEAGFPDIRIVIGDAHPTIEGDSILKGSRSIDYVIKNEGKLALTISQDPKLSVEGPAQSVIASVQQRAYPKSKLIFLYITQPS